MALSNAVKSFGTLLKIGDGAGSENFTTLSEVRSINGLSISAKTVDVTNHSAVDPWEQVVATILTGGTVTFGINWIPTDATHSYSTGILRDMVNRTRRNFQLVFPDGSSTTWTFANYIVDFKVDAPVEGVLMANITLKVTGKPTLA